MTLWAIVPVKPLRRGKSRLANILTEDERTALNQNLLVNTIKTLSTIDRIHKIMVVSRDPAALTFSREHGAITVRENGNPELNTALRRAAAVAETQLVNEILIIPADIPLISKKEINHILDHGGKPPEMVICPDRRKDGTNLLYLNPIGMIQFNYGSGSFQKHLSQAERAGLRIEIVESESIGLDLDLPEDLELLKLYQVAELTR
jgi:2-phospho-L-lactate guanylyltransferase